MLIENSAQAFDAIEEIASVRGNAKQELLTEYLQASPFLLTVVKAAYDPFITYGIKKLPEVASLNNETFDFQTLNVWKTLDGLAERKYTGDLAKTAVEVLLKIHCEKSQELLRRIIKKDMRAGFTAKSVNKAIPGSIYVFECMLSHKYEEKRIKQWPVAVEPKYDGVRILGRYKDGKCRFFSRTGKEFFNFDHIAEVIESIGLKNDFMFDGEIMSNEGFNEIVGAVHRKGQQAHDSYLQAFDIIPLKHFDAGKCDLSYKQRSAALHSMIERVGSPYFRKTPVTLAHNNHEVEAAYQKIRDMGGEGIIVKPMEAPYECKRSYNWLKIKDRQHVDVPILGFEQGTGKNSERLGALICDFKGVEVKVGGGLTDYIRDEIWSNQDSYKNRLIEVEYHEITPDKSLRHPRFIQFRDDKPVEDGVGV